MSEIGPNKKGLQSVREELERFVGSDDAQLVLCHIEECVVSVDAELDRIRRDPLLSLHWDYDGRVFSAKQGFGFQVAFDGINILEWLKTNLHILFRARSTSQALAEVSKELDTFVWLAEARRIHWEEEGHLNLLPKSVFDSIIEDLGERFSAPGGAQTKEMTREEELFFRRYEKQLALSS